MSGFLVHEGGSWQVKYTRSVGSKLNVYRMPLSPDDALNLDEGSLIGKETPVSFYVDRLLLRNAQTIFVAKLKKD